MLILYKETNVYTLKLVDDLEDFLEINNVEILNKWDEVPFQFSLEQVFTELKANSLLFPKVVWDNEDDEYLQYKGI